MELPRSQPMTVEPVPDGVHIRDATEDDLATLLQVEQSCFQGDRLSRRSFKRWLRASHAELLLAEDDTPTREVLGYGLVWLHKGTRLARLYSLAVMPSARGRGVARKLLSALERAAAQRGRLYMRLEVAKKNHSAIALYQSMGYQVFGEYFDYYDDHDDALRMQKKIQRLQDGHHNLTPWYPQTTEFTCGPAALMMAMSSMRADMPLTRELELDLWREATTIYMTSGHGGCHPIGLAISARRRGFKAEVFLNTEGPLFVDGVRTPHKKEVMSLVHQQFVQQAGELDIPIHYRDFSQKDLESMLGAGRAVLMLISTYRLDGKKAPHWVAVTGMDEHCFYVHDPELDAKEEQLAIDCQYLPIAREDFDLMTSFGAGRLRAAVVLDR